MMVAMVTVRWESLVHSKEKILPGHVMGDGCHGNHGMGSPLSELCIVKKRFRQATWWVGDGCHGNHEMGKSLK